jgi:Tat protein translocase TatB subunit
LYFKFFCEGVSRYEPFLDSSPSARLARARLLCVVHSRQRIMFNLGFGEILVICVVLIIVVGPERLPSLMKNVGKAVRTMRQASRDLQASVGLDEILREDVLRPPPARAPSPPATISREAPQVVQVVPSVDGETAASAVSTGLACGPSAQPATAHAPVTQGAAAAPSQNAQEIEVAGSPAGGSAGGPTGGPTGGHQGHV